MFNHDILVDEALKLFHKYGVRTTMDELASNLRISKRTLYEQVGNKSDLILYIMEYFTKKMDDYYSEVLSKDNIALLNKFKMLLSAATQRIFFNEKQLLELKVDYPQLYLIYQTKINKRWERLYQILDEYLKTVPQINIDKKTFRLTYMSALEGISTYIEQGNNENFKDLVSQMTDLLLSGIVPISSGVFGGIALPDLLSTLSVGVCFFDVYDHKIVPQYLSPGYLKLYHTEEISKENDLTTKLHPEDSEYFFEQFANAIKKDTIVSSFYRIISNGKIFWHRLEAIKIKKDNNYTFLAVIIDETKTKEDEFNLRLSEQRLKLAFEQISVTIWECDIENHVVTMVSPGPYKEIFDENPVVTNIPESLMSTGLIHPDSANAINSFYKKIYAGDKSGNCIAKVKGKNNEFIWNKFSFRTIFDDNNKPIKAVAISEKINNVVDVKSRFSQEEGLHKVLSKELLLSIEINLSRDEVTRYTNANLIPNLKVNNQDSYNDFFEGIKKSLIYEEESQRFVELFSISNVLEGFDNGKTSIHQSFRCCQEDGKILWVSYTANIVAEPITGDIFLFGYIRDIDVKMKLELSLSRKVEYDVTTRLYITSTTKKMTNLALAKEDDASALCGFVLIEIINFAQIKRQYGLDVGDKVLFYIGRVLRICFNNKNIVGRVLDNQFGIFFPIVEDPNALRNRIDDIVSIAHNSYSITSTEKQITKIRTSIVINRISNSNYDRLFYLASKKLEKIKDSLNENEDIIDNINEFFKEENKKSEDNEIITGEKVLNSYNLLDTSNIELTEILLDCATTLLSRDTIKNNIDYILKRVYSYYKAYRACIFEYDKETDCINCTYEYCENGSEMISLFANLNVDKIPNFFNFKKGHQSVIINSVKEINTLTPLETSFIKDLNMNSFYMAPLITDNHLAGYVCINNPTEHLGELSLINSLAYFLTNEIIRNRLEEKQRFLDEYDVLTELRNHSSFRKRVFTLRKMMLSSLGVACLQINDLRLINSENDSEYTDSMVLVVSQALKHQFRDLDLYRYGSEKFAVLCADINYHIFNDKIKRLIEEINEVNPGLVTVGHTWSDNDIDVEKLIIHSEEIIFINRKEPQKINDKVIVINEKLINLIESIEKGWYEVFLQPKIDIQSNEVCGAEALIRMNHPLYGLVSPAKMIPILEREKLVSYVDLFVLEQTCKMLNRWKMQNRKLLPIAVNYSRMTLLEKDIIEKTLNIINKYQVPNFLIEIEITETIGNMEQKIILEMANRFIEAGFRLAIDDFGSKFSSLSTLSLIPFSVVKLDKSIVNDLVVNIRSQVIVEYVIMMCKKLGMKSVAEGIENEAQLKALISRGCDYGQGYFFEKPIPIGDFEEKYNPQKGN